MDRRDFHDLGRLGRRSIPSWMILSTRLRSSPVKKISKKLKATPSQVALAWLLAKSPVMLPIPGTKDLEHLEQNVAAAKLQLTKEELDVLG